MKNYIGRKIRGFRFEDGTDNVDWVGWKEELVNEIGEVEFQHENYVVVKFDDRKWAYPISLIHEHLVEEETTSPQIIDLSNVDGVKMMVSDDKGLEECKKEKLYTKKDVLNLLDFVNDRLPDLYSRFNPQEELEEWHKVEIVKED
jgi:hypothetical protein